MSDRMSRARETRAAVLRTGLGLMFGLLLSGCLGRSPAVEHFMLGKIDGPPQVSSSDEPGLAVLVGPVKLPAYLERPQIARLEENGEVELEEFSRWLGGFEENFLRSTSLGLARKLDSIKVVVPFSSDRSEVLHGLRSIMRETGAGQTRESTRHDLLDKMRRLRQDTQPSSTANNYHTVLSQIISFADEEANNLGVPT